MFQQRCVYTLSKEQETNPVIDLFVCFGCLSFFPGLSTFQEKSKEFVLGLVS